MSLKQRCIYCPDHASYAHADSASPYKRVQLDGGRGRYRSDLLTSSKFVDVQWIVPANAYNYLNNFYSLFKRRPEAFLISLIIDEDTLTDCDAWFMPGTFRLVSKQGNAFTVSAQLEVIPPVVNQQQGDILISLISYFGPDWQLYEDRLNIIVNLDLPQAMPIPPRPING